MSQNPNDEISLNEIIRNIVKNNINQDDLKEKINTAIDKNLATLQNDVDENIARVVSDAIANQISMKKPTSISNFQFSSGDMLTHARSLFEYHAGQRLTSIRYYFIAIALLANAYFAVLKIENSELPQLIVCLITAIITLGFLALDRRNAELVETDEIALQELEDRAACAHTSDEIQLKDRTGSRKFRITYNADKGVKYRSKLFQYSSIILVLLSTIFIVSLIPIFNIAVKNFDIFTAILQFCLR